MFSENRAVYEIIWENTESTIAFPQQQKLPEIATVLGSVFAAYLLTLRQIFLERSNQEAGDWECTIDRRHWHKVLLVKL